jgi:hypothetical protein
MSWSCRLNELITRPQFVCGVARARIRYAVKRVRREPAVSGLERGGNFVTPSLHPSSYHLTEARSALQLDQRAMGQPLGDQGTGTAGGALGTAGGHAVAAV